ncbi:MAG: V-type ATPase subunit [Spirochaetales bacterium]|nr:V-type ATPase subunit [Spirochaetales bacterium]
MGKTAVSEYGYINAKLRTRIGRILTDDFKKILTASDDLEEAVQVLQNFGFEKIAEVWNSTGDIQSVEFELLKRHLENFRMVMKNTQGELKDFASLLAIKPEIENIKNTLRLWYGSRVKKRPISYRSAFIYKDRIFEDIDWDALVNAVSQEDINGVFKNTLYRSAFTENLADKAGSGIFKTEIMLDKIYYANLLEQSRILKNSDYNILKDIITIEIDLQNISWMIRYRHFYNMSFMEMKDIMIPGGSSLQFDILEKNEDAAQGSITPTDLLKKDYPELSAFSISDKHNFSGQALLLEQLLDETRKTKFTNLLIGYPFTVGIILVYLFMSEREMKYISSVLNRKYYKMGTRQMEEQG